MAHATAADMELSQLNQQFTAALAQARTLAEAAHLQQVEMPHPSLSLHLSHLIHAVTARLSMHQYAGQRRQ